MLNAALARIPGDFRWLGIAIAGFAFFHVCAPAASQSQDTNEKGTPDVVFVPPKIGAPADRLGAGTRDVGMEAGGPLVLIVPAGGGLTTSETPPLVWYLSEGFRGTMLAAVSAIGGDGVAMRQSGAFPPGYYGLDLRRSDMRMSTGQIFELRVELSEETRVASKATGLIERVPDTDQDPGLAGLWFDALGQYVSIGLSGRVRILDVKAFEQLLDAGGIKR